MTGVQTCALPISDLLPGVAPPPNSTHASGPWLLVGIVIGPRAEEIPDSNKPAGDTDWSHKVLEILEEHGLEETKDQVM